MDRRSRTSRLGLGDAFTDDPVLPPKAAVDATSVSPPDTEINPLSGIQGTNPLADALTLSKKTDPFPYHDETYLAAMAKMAAARKAKELSPEELRAFGLLKAEAPADSAIPQRRSTSLDDEVAALMSGIQRTK